MAAGNTYTPLATQTLGSAAASVTFSSISGAYTDLVLVMRYSNASADSSFLRFNSDSGSNYSTTYLYGNGTTAGSTRESNYSLAYLDIFTSNASGDNQISIVNIMNYANTTTYKTLINRNSHPEKGVSATVSLWRNTAAITTVYLANGSGGNFATGSTFTLYGIAAA